MPDEAMPVIETPILIVGAGPVGLQTALDLGWRGVECVIIDQGDGKPVLNPRASGLSARTMEFLRRWGLAETVRKEGFPSNLDMSILCLHQPRRPPHRPGGISPPSRATACTLLA